MSPSSSSLRLFALAPLLLSSLLLSSLLLSLSAPAAHAQFINVNFTGPTYTATVTPNSATPPSDAVPAQLTSLPAATAASPLLPIGFPFTFYGLTYSNVTVQTDGYMQFSTPAVVTSAPSAMPTGFASSLILPVLAFFGVDMTTTTTAQASYGTFGTAPSRYFLYRIAGARYAAVASSSLTFDVLLFETTGVIEMRYYSLTSASASVLIGAMAGPWRYLDGSYDFTAPLNAVPLNDTTFTTYNGSTVRFTPSSLTLPAYTPSYTVTSAPLTTEPTTLRSPNIFYAPRFDTLFPVNIGFTFTFCNVQYRAVTVSISGYLQFVTSSTTTSLTAYGTAAAPMTPFFGALFARYVANAYTDRTWERVGTYPDRRLIIRFFEVRFSTVTTSVIPEAATFVITLFERDSSIRVDYHRVDPVLSSATLNTFTVGLQCSATSYPNWSSFDNLIFIPAGAAANASNAALIARRSLAFTPTRPVGIPPYSDLTTFSGYLNAAYGSYQPCTLSTASALTAFTSPETLAVPADGTPVRAAIGFNFPFFLDRYSHVFVSLYGYIRFAHDAIMPGWTASSTAPWTLPLPESQYGELPLLAVGAAPWVATNATLVQMQRSGDGSVSLRSVVIRWSNLAYPTNTSSSLTMQATLAEAPGTVTFSWFRVDDATGNLPITVGAQGVPLDLGPMTDGVQAIERRNYYVLWNATSLSVAASALRGVSATMTPLLVPVTRTLFTNAPRSYVAAMTALNYTTLNLAPPPATGYTIAAQDVPTLNTTRAWPVSIGFDFYFYGRPYSTAIVHVDGFLYFTTNATNFTSPTDPLPFAPIVPPVSFPLANVSSAVVPPFIAFMGTAMQMGVGSSIAFTTDGVAPDRRFTLRYDRVQVRTTTLVSGQPANASVFLTLYEANGTVAIAMSYFSTSTSLTLSIGVHDMLPNPTIRFDGNVDASPYIFAAQTVSTLRNNLVTFTWQSNITANVTELLNIGTPLSSLSFVTNPLDYAPGTVLYTFATVGPTREAHLIAHGATFGGKLRQLLAETMGGGVPVSSVQLLNVVFSTSYANSTLGNGMSIVRTAAVEALMVVTMALLPTSGLSAAAARSAVNTLVAALYDPTSTMYTTSNVLNQAGGGMGANRPLLSAWTADPVIGASAAASAVGTITVTEACADGSLAAAGQCPTKKTSSSVDLTWIVVGVVLGVAIAIVLVVLYWRVRNGDRVALNALSGAASSPAAAAAMKSPTSNYIAANAASTEEAWKGER